MIAAMINFISIVKKENNFEWCIFFI